MERMSTEATHIQENMLKETASGSENQARISNWVVIGLAIACVFAVAHYYRNRYQIPTDISQLRASKKSN
jgi:hypothetical protein